MGSPKALLVLQGRTFLERVVAAMRDGGCDLVVVVTGPRSDPDAGRIADLAEELGARVAINPDRDSEQVESLRVGLGALPGSPDAVVSMPVDAPGATGEVVRTLIDAVRGGASIAVPTFGGRRGHPVVFAASVLPDLLDPDLAEGARTVLARHEGGIAELPLGDPDVLLDVDTPQQYERLLEERE